MRNVNIVGVVIISMIICGMWFVTAGDVIVTPDEICLDLIAGDTVTEMITIKWEGEEKRIFYMDSNITPDGMGFYISFSEDTFVLDTGEEKTLDMIIQTDMLLSPGEYIINLDIDAEELQIPEGNGDENGDGGRNPTGWATKGHSEEYIPIVLPPINNTDDDFINVIYCSARKDNGFSFPIWILGVILIVFIIIVLFVMKRKNVE